MICQNHGVLRRLKTRLNIEVENGKEAKIRARVSDSENHREREPETAVFVIRDCAQRWPPAQTIIVATIKFEAF
jgi:hypothetical protein